MGIFDFLGGPQAMPTGAPDEGFDLGDRLMSPLSQIGLQLLANNGRPTSEGMFNGVPQAVAQGARYQAVKKEQKEAKAKENQTLAFLRKNHPDIASMVDGGLSVGDAFNYAMKEREFAAQEARANRGPGPTDDMREFEFAQQNPAFGEFLNRGTTAGRLSTQPVWGQDAQGNAVLGQMSNDGRFVPSAMPDGVRPLSPYETNFSKAAGTTGGNALGAAQSALPGASGTAKMVSDNINSLKSDPYLPSMVGSVDSWLPNVSSDAARVQSKIDQLQGGAFLEARKLLAGGGQITDYEGKKAEAAFVRMNTAQNEKDFNDALDEFNTNVQAGLAKLQQQAGGGRSSTRGPVSIGGYTIEEVP